MITYDHIYLFCTIDIIIIGVMYLSYVFVSKLNSVIAICYVRFLLFLKSITDQKTDLLKLDITKKNHRVGQRILTRNRNTKMGIIVTFWNQTFKSSYHVNSGPPWFNKYQHCIVFYHNFKHLGLINNWLFKFSWWGRFWPGEAKLLDTQPWLPYTY